ncbi:MAG: D-alanine--D-alanine ligase [Actinomycetota bacterium]|nr:D-alanine--D-alanine ligase [Actinomycetota bacterium]
MNEVRRATNVVVLMGGRSAEREVSLNTASQVAAALRETGHTVTEIDSAEPDFIEQLRHAGPDAVFICLHGRFGEDGTVQGLLELLDIPYVGSGVLASALAMDKLMSKRVFEHAGLASPQYVELHRSQPIDLDAIVAKLGAKSVVKPANEGSSVGMSIVHEPSELAAAIEKAFACDEGVLVERFVAGAEVTVGVIGNADIMALPTLEIVPEHEFYDYESKYVPGMSSHIIPARVSQEARDECQSLALAAHRLLGCRGMSRADTIVTADGEVWLLEINTIPGMTSTSLLPDSARAAGIEFPQLCERLVALAMEPR